MPIIDLDIGSVMPMKITSSFLSPVLVRSMCIISSCLDIIFASLTENSYTFEVRQLCPKLKC